MERGAIEHMLLGQLLSYLGIVTMSFHKVLHCKINSRSDEVIRQKT